MALVLTSSNLPLPLASLAFGLRDGLRPTLVLHALRWLFALLMAWLGLFAWVGDRWWSLPTLTSALQRVVNVETSTASTLAAGLFVWSYVLVVLTSVFLLNMYVLMPRIRRVCLARYPRLVTGLDAPSVGWRVLARHTVWMLLATLWATGLSWVLPGLGAVLGLVIMAHANVRGLVVDALQDLATADELSAVLRRQRHAITLLGLVLSVIALVPMLGLSSLLVMGPCCSHFAFRALLQQRDLS
jgi:hypothetical protein